MLKITFTNTRGESVTIGRGAPYLLNTIEGLGEVEAENQTQTFPYQDGFVPLDTILRERVIPFTITIVANYPGELNHLRKQISRVFNPKLGEGTLIYEDGYQVKMIKGKADSLPTFPAGSGNRTPLTQVSSISLSCSNPYWQDLQAVSRALVAYEGKFSFPFIFPTQFGIEGDSTTLYNEGDTATPVVVTIQGPINKPMIENRTTGEYMRVNTAIGADEVLYIDTNPRHKRVEIHRPNQIIKAMGYFEHAGDFWQLQVGANEVRFQASEGIAEAIAAISWHNQYIGI